MRKYEIFFLGNPNAGVKHYTFGRFWFYLLILLFMLSISAFGGAYMLQHLQIQQQQAFIEEQESDIAKLQEQINTFSDKERQIEFLKAYVDELKFVAYDSEKSLKEHQTLYDQNVKLLAKLGKRIHHALNIDYRYDDRMFEDVHKTLEWMQTLQGDLSQLEASVEQFAAQKSIFDEQEASHAQIQQQMAQTEQALLDHLNYIHAKAKSLDRVFGRLKNITGVQLDGSPGPSTENMDARGGPSSEEQKSLDFEKTEIRPELRSYLLQSTSYYDEVLRSLDVLGQSLSKDTKAWRSTPTGLPVYTLAISDGFGKRIDPFTKKWDFHAGLDFTADIGTPIYATADGTVKKAYRWGGYGLFIEIDHGKGMSVEEGSQEKVHYFTRYGHLSKLLVKKGQKVKRGDIIGHVGNTGRSTGPHLHYEILVGKKYVNPDKLILQIAIQ